MRVTAVVNGGTNLYNLTVTRAYDATVIGVHTAGDNVLRVTYPNLTIMVTNTGGVSAVATGDTIQIENEQMAVSNVTGSGPWALTVTRAVNGTTARATTPAGSSTRSWRTPSR